MRSSRLLPLADLGGIGEPGILDWPILHAEALVEPQPPP